MLRAGCDSGHRRTTANVSHSKYSSVQCGLRYEPHGASNTGLLYDQLWMLPGVVQSIDVRRHILHKTAHGS